jgi:hypothetical protein
MYGLTQILKREERWLYVEDQRYPEIPFTGTIT